MEIIEAGGIENRIFLIRGLKVMLDVDLAGLYGVSTKRLNEQVKRNKERFPEDFMFRISEEEFKQLVGIYKEYRLRSQNATSKRGGRTYYPLAFTEQGIAMLSGVLRSKRAVKVNIAIMRAFVKLRDILISHRELEHKLYELEGRIENHDEQIHRIFDAIREMMAPDVKPAKRIGFCTDE